jgi:hypothetical protein
VKLPENEIEELVRRKLEGESYSGIRATLGERGFNEEEVHEIIRKIDEKVLDAELNQKQLGKSRQWYRAGLFLASLGLLLTLGTNRGIILEGVPRWVVYTPFFAGIAMMLYGRYWGQKSRRETDRGPGPIRRRRPFK